MGGGRRGRDVFVLLMVAAIGRYTRSERKEREGVLAKPFAEQRCGGVYESAAKSIMYSDAAGRTRRQHTHMQEREIERRGAGIAR